MSAGVPSLLPLDGEPSPPDDVRAAALRQHRLRRPVVILPPRTKAPRTQGWPTLRYSEDQLAAIDPTANLGLLLGAASGLVDVDLDCAEARALAPALLPSTPMRHGRPSAQEAHYWYAVSSPTPKVVRYRDPAATGAGAATACLVELRSGNNESAAQTMIPPSIHPSGERLAWAGGALDAEPAHVEIADLQRAVARVAAAALLSRHYPAPGSRHNHALALAGLLLLGEMSVDDARQLVGVIARAAGDEEAIDRERAADDTAARIAAGERVTGANRLAEIIGADGQRIVAAARKWLGLRDTPSAGAQQRDPGVERDGDTRPQIIISTDEPAVIDAAIAALARAPEGYSRGPEIVEVVTDAPTTAGVTRSGPVAWIHRSPEPRVREILAREARWLAPGGDGAPVAAHPPQWAVRAVMARGHWPALRPLVAVAEVPTMRPDGTILAEPGYDPATGIYLAPGVCVSIPDRPTREQAAVAVADLGELIAEFPVATAAGRSAWLAGVIAAAVRPAIDGPTPMTIVDASVAGAGKTLMADAAAVITTGRPAPRTVYVADDAEMRKRITALALVGDPLALLDNIVGTVGCPSLDAALTGTTWRDRVLGASQMTGELPLRTVWWATGNGLVIGADLVRRALLVRLEPMTEHPEERRGWRHPHLLDHVRNIRPTLVSAALTIPRAYIVAGRPDQGLTAMGSYTAWSDLVRSALVWTGMPDPCATIAEIRACDPSTDELRRVIEAWPEREGTPITVGALLAQATPNSQWRAALADWCPPRGSDPLPTARTLGNRLRAVRRRVVGDRCLDIGQRGRDGMSWLVRRVTP